MPVTATAAGGGVSNSACGGWPAPTTSCGWGTALSVLTRRPATRRPCAFTRARPTARTGCSNTSNARNQDVAGRLRSLIRNGHLTTVSDSTMGTDPAPGAKKTLWVTYNVGGRSGNQPRTVPEDGQLNIP